MKTFKKVLIVVALILFGAVVSRVITYMELTAEYGKLLQKVQDNEAASKVLEIETVIDEFFVGESDAKTRADAAANALVESTGDRWSYYIPAEEYQSYEEQMANEYVGIGITISLDEESSGYAITEVTKGGPAEEAGVKVGDILIGVDDTDIRGMELAEVRTLVRGEEGTSVVLKLLRKGTEKTITTERRTIEQIVATGTMLDETVGYIRITNFDSKCADQTIAAIETVLEKGAESLIFDVRNNPGGYQSELVEVLDYLLPKGVLFRMKYYDGTEKVDRSNAKCLDIPMAVLINEESYSAAEFFAAAMQEYEAAEIVGMQTCGKGYFQNTYPLRDGSAVVLSSGTYYTPNNVSLTDIGVCPDVVVEMSEAEYQDLYYNLLSVEEDEQLQAAWDLLR